MALIKSVSPLPDDLDAPTQSLLGLSALAAELAGQGVSVMNLFARSGIEPTDLENPKACMSHRQRLVIYRNARSLAKRTDIALVAGARQRLSDYGIYGYALVSSATFRDALLMSLEHVTMAGPAVRRITFSIESDMAILRSHGLESLGDILPFGAEFWRSSMTSLFSHVLGTQFPSRRMVFTYPPPPHWRHYERVFHCPIDFNGDAMEWHFDAAVLDQPCPNANPITAQICQQFCDRVMGEESGRTDLARRIRATCLNNAPRFPPAEEIAVQLGLSLRTLHRKLADSGLSYQAIIDDLRRSLATEFLQNTELQIDQVADRVGFADATSFRKAFKKWTGHSPGFYRRPSEHAPDGLSDEGIGLGQPRD